jgi:DNA-directed RNA polymerase II subunit RPB2
MGKFSICYVILHHIIIFIINVCTGKQAIACSPLDAGHRIEGKLHVLNYPQKSIVSTWAAELTEYTDNPAGTVCTVAIMCYTGHNQEDSLIFNKGALDRGLFRSSYHRVYKESNVIHGNDSEYICAVDPKATSKAKADYSKIGDE